MAANEANTPGALPTNSAPPKATQYEFSEEQNKTIAGVAWGFRILGLVLALQAIKTAIRFFFGISNLLGGPGRQVSCERVFEYGVFLVFLVPLAVWLYGSSFS